VSAPVAEFNVAHEGNVPEITVQLLYGGVPPVAANVCEYAAFTVACGSGDAVVIDGVVGTTCSANTLLPVAAALSVTVTVNVNGLPVVFGGVPVSTPVPAAKVAQLGAVPRVIAQFVYGGVPPIAANVWL
jgi:hypothetical protein